MTGLYVPPYSRWDDRAAALDFAAARNFAALVTAGGDAPLVSHLPFLIDIERNVLRGHLARANPHAARLGGERHVAVFAGPDAYISPDWYGEKSEDVPTWNYVAVHVAGTGRVVADPDAVDAFLADLSAHEEHRRPDAETGKIWTLDKVPPEKHARMRAAIVAFEIDIEKVEAKAKLSQNKKAGQIAGAVRALAGSAIEREREIAALMERWIK